MNLYGQYIGRMVEKMFYSKLQAQDYLFKLTKIHFLWSQRFLIKNLDSHIYISFVF